MSAEIIKMSEYKINSLVARCKARGHLMYYLTSKELATRTLGPRPARESKEYLNWRKASLLEQERKEVLREIVNAMVDGNEKKASRLIDKYQVEPTDGAIEAEILKRKLTRQERKSMKEPGIKEEYQHQREGEIY